MTNACVTIASLLPPLTPTLVPQSYLRQGTGSLPRIGWTVQNSPNVPVFREFVASGVIPDWSGDGSSTGGGRYDQTPAVAYGDYNPLNRAPLGDSVLDGMDGEPDDPNKPTEDVGGSTGDSLEW